MCCARWKWKTNSALKRRNGPGLKLNDAAGSTHDVGILGLNPHELEDVFLQLTGGGGIVDEPPEAAGQEEGA